MAELVARGETVCAVVGSAFASEVRDTGAEVVVLDAVPDVFVPERFVGAAAVRFVVGRVRRPRVNARAARSLAGELRRRRPNLVVVDPMIGWADRIARRFGVPSAVFSTTFAYDARVCAALGGAGRWLSPLRPMVRRCSRPGRLVLANAVPELQPAAGRRAPDVHLIGPLPRARRPDRPAMPSHLPDGHRLLFVSPGTVFARGPAFFRAIVEAFTGEPWILVLATAHLDPTELGPMPSNVLVQRSVPQLEVLERSHVFLTHAGMNSSIEGLMAGIPMALVPRSREQRFLAGRLAALGVGKTIDVGQDDPQQLRQEITALAEDPAVRVATAAWRDRLLGAGGAGLAADLLCDRITPRRANFPSGYEAADTSR